MRIVAGTYGGRRLEVPKGRDIRPTSDKVRGAIFNALTSRGMVQSARVLDCFCGTGALGLEALSRGASHCTFVDSAPESLKLTKINAAALDAKAADFILKDAGKLPPAPQGYTLLFLDPPYNKDLILPTLAHLDKQGWIAPGAMIVIEAEKNFTAALPAPFTLLDERTYGDTKVIYASL